MEGASASQDERRLIQLYREYGPSVYRRCFRLLREREAARDATQEVFVKLLRDVRKFDERASALPWIYRVATNHCLNVLRQGRRHGDTVSSDALEICGDASDTFPERQLAQRVLARFDSVTQAIAVGVLVDGMEHEELAGVLGISRRTVHRKLTRFLEKARLFLARSDP